MMYRYLGASLANINCSDIHQSRVWQDIMILKWKFLIQKYQDRLYILGLMARF